MDCTNLHTAAEVLEAFRTCRDIGEEIELFECLATRPEPPLEAFVELLRSIKLEPVLALTIQAFGKITNADIKARLKQSDDLLEMLSRQAQAGSTDLIRWSAATTIESVGFDFIAVSQHLSEEPRNIAEKIVKYQVKRLADRELIQSNDYDAFVRFWTYGSITSLRFATLINNGENACRTVLDVLNNQKLWGIKEVNLNLSNAENFSSRRELLELGVSDNLIEIWENELFEKAAQTLSARLLTQLNQMGDLNQDATFEMLMEVQLHCLQSNNSRTRQQAAQTILETRNFQSKLGNDFFGFMLQDKPFLVKAVIAFSFDYGSINHVNSDLNKIAENLRCLMQKLARKKVRQDCQVWHDRILQELEERRRLQKLEERRRLQELEERRRLQELEERRRLQELEERRIRFEARRKQSFDLRAKLEDNLNQIRAINLERYEQVFRETHFEQPPQVNVKNEQYVEVLTMYDSSLSDKLSKLQRIHKSITKENQVENALNEIKKLDIQGYEKVFSDFIFPSFPILIFDENKDKYYQVLQQHDKSLIELLQKYREQWNSYYSSVISPVSSRAENARSVCSSIENSLSNLKYPGFGQGCLLFFVFGFFAAVSGVEASLGMVIYIVIHILICLAIWIAKLMYKRQIEQANQRYSEIRKEVEKLSYLRKKVDDVLWKIIQKIK